MKNQRMFKELLETLENAYNTPNTSDSEKAEALAKTAKIITQSVLKKILNAMNSGATENGTTPKGGQYENYLRRLKREAWHNENDGEALNNAAIIALLEEINRQLERGETVDLERPYTIKRLSKRIYIQSKQSAAYKESETTPIQQVFKAVRREIQQNASPKIVENGYSYIEGEFDPVTGEKTYYRAAKYADIGGYTTDIKGAICYDHYTTSYNDFMEYNSVVEKLTAVLSPVQKIVFEKRLQGYGHKAIATYCGFTPDTAKYHLKAIQKHAEKIGITYNK